ncbi:MAG TPA: galactokinase [Vicinamibacterales bacterium]|nr:galactokinase [Vicinamibacterales bacterium]
MFASYFGKPPEQKASAPGRVNLIGEHTDYNGGFCLPTVLPLHTQVWVAPRSDQMVRLASDAQEGDVAEYTIGAEKPASSWVDYVAGVTWTLRRGGHRLAGFDMLITSDVPVGKGLSSSAALEVAALRGLRSLLSLQLSDLDIAMLAHAAETQFVGAPVGVMDQMVCSMGKDGFAFFLDAASREFKQVPMPDQTALRVIDSGIAHHHASGDYRTRRQECEEAARALKVTNLRDLTPADLPRINALPEPLNRRARHVVTEDARVLEAVDALRAGDLRKFGALLKASHASLRDDFQVSLAEIDWLVDTANNDPDVLGARLTGGGFGGAILMLCKPGAPADTAERVVTKYHDEYGKKAEVLVS